MSNEIMVSKWGYGLGVKIPRGIVTEGKISEGDRFALTVQPDGSIVLRPRHRKFELADLVGRITAENCHSETDWGKPEGREIW